MSASAPQPQTGVLDKFGMMLGAVAGFLGTMPLYHYTYRFFNDFLLRYSDYGSYGLWDLAWKLCLFLFILTATWFALVMVVNILKGLLISLVVLFKKVGR